MAKKGKRRVKNVKHLDIVKINKAEKCKLQNKSISAGITARIALSLITEWLWWSNTVWTDVNLDFTSYFVDGTVILVK